VTLTLLIKIVRGTPDGDLVLKTAPPTLASLLELAKNRLLASHVSLQEKAESEGTPMRALSC